MALSSTSIQQPKAPTGTPLSKFDPASALLATLLLTMYAGKASAKQLRKLKRQVAWEAFKTKAKSFLHNPFKPASVSDRTLIYILIGLLVIILIFVSPIAAIAALLLGILLVLLLRP
ncbi:MAG: hypothetical protein C4329_07380 [Chitinophagaceae bacterium]